MRRVESVSHMEQRMQQAFLCHSANALLCNKLAIVGMLLLAESWQALPQCVLLTGLQQL